MWQESKYLLTLAWSQRQHSIDEVTGHPLTIIPFINNNNVTPESFVVTPLSLQFHPWCHRRRAIGVFPE